MSDRISNQNWCWTHQLQVLHPAASCCQYNAVCMHSPNDQCDVTYAAVIEEVDVAAIAALGITEDE